MDHSKNTLVESEKFDDKVHRVGVITTIIMWVFFIGVPLGVTLYFKLKINIVTLITTAVPIAITFALVGLAEKLSMAPIIGPGAIYLASTTGNVQNMKLPAALNAMRIMGVEEGSEKGRVVSIIAVATSAVVTTTIVFLGMLFLAPMITPLLNKPHIKPAFDNMLPALMGPMVLPVVLKNTKSAIVPFTIAIIFALALGSSYGTLQSFVMVGVILISLGVFKLAMKKGISFKKEK